MLSVSSAVICGTLTEDIVIVFSGEWNCVKIDLVDFFAKCEFWLFTFKIIGQLILKYPHIRTLEQFYTCLLK